MRAVRIYTTPTCGWCRRAKALLREREIPFMEIDVSASPDVLEWLVRTTGRRGVPQVFADDSHIGGFDDLAALDRSGELRRLLGLDAA